MSICWPPLLKGLLIAVRMLRESIYEHVILRQNVQCETKKHVVPNWSHLLNARYRAESHCYSNFLLFSSFPHITAAYSNRGTSSLAYASESACVVPIQLCANTDS
jgi:hypothetical protein